MPVDRRPELSATLKRLARGEGPLWATWQGKRLLLSAPDEAFLARPVGEVLLAMRSGYRCTTLIGRHPEKVGGPPKIWEEGMYRVVRAKLIRAVILEQHDRAPSVPG